MGRTLDPAPPRSLLDSCSLRSVTSPADSVGRAARSRSVTSRAPVSSMPAPVPSPSCQSHRLAEQRVALAQRGEREPATPRPGGAPAPRAAVWSARRTSAGSLPSERSRGRRSSGGSSSAVDGDVDADPEHDPTFSCGRPSARIPASLRPSSQHVVRPLDHRRAPFAVECLGDVRDGERLRASAAIAAGRAARARHASARPARVHPAAPLAAMAGRLGVGGDERLRAVAPAVLRAAARAPFVDADASRSARAARRGSRRLQSQLVAGADVQPLCGAAAVDGERDAHPPSPS